MAKTASELIVRISGNADSYQKELEKVSKETKNLEKSLAKTAKISGVAFAAGTVAIVGATKAAADFENKFTDVVTLLDQGSFATKSLEQGIDSLKKGVLELGAETGESFDTLNAGLFDLVSSGVPAEEAIDTLRVTTQLAAAGATDTAIAVKALTATMTAFGDKAGTAQEISEKFFTAQKFGVTTVGELAKEFNKVAGLANNMGISFDEALASLSALTADGAKPTAEAATQLKAAMSGVINIQQNLSKESDAVQQALSLQNVEQKGLVGALMEMKEATGGNIVEMKRLLGSSEALSAVLSLTGAQSELVKKQMKAMADEEQRAAIFAEALATKQETTTKAMAKFQKAVEVAAILIGDQFAPILSKAADLMSSFFKVFADNPILIKSAALIVGIGTALAGLVTVAALASTAFLNVRAAMLALNISTKVLSIGIKGLVGATGLGLLIIVLSEVYANWDTIWPLMQKTFAQFYNYILPVLNTIVNGFIDGFNAIVGSAIKFGKAYIAIWKGIINAVIGVAKGLGDILVGVFTLDTDRIKKGVADAKKAVVEGAKDTFNEVKKTITEDSEPILAKVELEPMDIPEEKKKLDEQSKDLKVNVPVTTEGDKGTADKANAAFKKKEKDKTKFLTQEQKERIQQNKNALAVIAAQNKKASDEEIAFLQKKNDLALAEEKAMKEKNVAVRSSELELIRAQQAQLLADEQEYLARKKEQDAIAKEEKAAFQSEFNELTKEEQALFNEEELEVLQEQILTKQELENQVAQEKLEKQIATRNKFVKDEMKHGTTVAKINKVMGSDTVKQTKQTADQLVQLTQSKNNTLKSIGKAAATAQIAIDTARGAVAAYTSLAGIPIVGPALGAVAAGALIAYGAERTANVLAANEGGMVPLGAGIPGKDSVNALLTPGELVVPEKNFDEVVAAVSASRGGTTTATATATGEATETANELDLTIRLEPTGDLMDMIEQKIIERRVQGVGLL